MLVVHHLNDSRVISASHAKARRRPDFPRDADRHLRARLFIRLWAHRIGDLLASLAGWGPTTCVILLGLHGRRRKRTALALPGGWFGKAERSEDFPLRTAGDAAITAEEAPLVEFETPRPGQTAQGDIVRLGAGKMEQGGAVAFRRDNEQVGLESAREPDRRPGRTAGQDLLDLRQGGEGRRDPGSRRSSHQIHVPHVGTPAAKAPGYVGNFNAREAKERLAQRLRYGFRLNSRRPFRWPTSEGGRELTLQRRPEAGKVAKAPGGDRSAQIIAGLYAQFLVESPYTVWS
jgi:hypothetical protein